MSNLQRRADALNDEAITFIIIMVLALAMVGAFTVMLVVKDNKDKEKAQHEQAIKQHNM